MRKLSLLLLACSVSLFSFSQSYNLDSSLTAIRLQTDSTLRATIHADSMKIEKENQQMIKWEKLKSMAKYPAINAGPFSGVIPVQDPTEIPDPKLDYKLLFEVSGAFPDSSADGINENLVEIARIINLHVASGIPLKKIFPVIVVHGPVLKAISTNAEYQKYYKIDNPNLKVINDLVALGARFIACGQAMAFFDVKKEDLLPLVKISLTAQTVLSSYQLKGYVKTNIK